MQKKKSVFPHKGKHFIVARGAPSSPVQQDCLLIFSNGFFRNGAELSKDPKVRLHEDENVLTILERETNVSFLIPFLQQTHRTTQLSAAMLSKIGFPPFPPHTHHLRERQCKFYVCGPTSHCSGKPLVISLLADYQLF